MYLGHLLEIKARKKVAHRQKQFLYRYVIDPMGVLLYFFKTKIFSSRFQSPLPVDFFIVGLQKSGTSWLCSLLEAHPAINVFQPKPGKSYPAEGHLFDSLADPEIFYFAYWHKHQGYFRDIVSMSRYVPLTQLKAVIRGRFNAYALKFKRATLIGDKTTEYIFHLPELVAMYPSAKLIVILRDPRDRFISYWSQLVRKGKLHDEDRDVACSRYIERIQAEYGALLNLGPSNLFLLTYENLSRQPLATAKRLFDFLDVKISEAQLEKIVHDSGFQILSGRAVGAEDQASHLRKGVIGDWVNTLSEAQAKNIIDALLTLTEEIERSYHVDLTAYKLPS